MKNKTYKDGLKKALELLGRNTGMDAIDNLAGLYEDLRFEGDTVGMRTLKRVTDQISEIEIEYEKTPDEIKISQEELKDIFGDYIPIEILNVITSEELSINEIRAYINGYITASEIHNIKVSPGLYMSIAMRLDHAMGCPGYYDNLRFGVNQNGITHAQRLEALLSDIKRVFEELAGNGFYSTDKEEYYLDILKKSIPDINLDDLTA